VEGEPVFRWPDFLAGTEVDAPGSEGVWFIFLSMFRFIVLISLLSGLSIVSTTKVRQVFRVPGTSIVIFLNSGTSATASKLNSTIIKGYKKILGKFVDAYSPDSDNDCRGGGGGHQHLHPPCARFLHSFREITATKC
jgi:hypothetical protein